MKNKILAIVLTAIFGTAVFFLIITASIGLPIYLRFFYYLHINALGLPESTGYDYATIKTAYDQVLNYLTLPNREFGTGALAFTAEGASHFADCKVLFNLNLIVLIISAIIILTLLILNAKKVITLCRPFKMNVAFLSACSVLFAFVVLGVVVSIDFNTAFIVFHKLFFAGKDNWTFHPNKDEIIKILPQQFFMNCAIFILLGIVLISLSIILVQIIKRKKRVEKNKNF